MKQEFDVKLSLTEKELKIVKIALLSAGGINPEPHFNFSKEEIINIIDLICDEENVLQHYKGKK